MKRNVYYDADGVEHEVSQSQVENHRESLDVGRVGDKLFAQLNVTTEIRQYSNRLDLDLFILRRQHVKFDAVKYSHAKLISQQLAVRSVIEEHVGDTRDSVENELFALIDCALVDSFDEALNKLLDFSTLALEAMLSKLLLSR